MDILKEIRELEKENIFIFFSHDLYKDGSNCSFSILFGNHNSDDNQTGWYGDDHEFGDTADVMVRAIEVAWFMNKNLDYIKWYFYSAKETRSKEGYDNMMKSMEIQKKISEFIFKK